MANGNGKKWRYSTPNDFRVVKTLQGSLSHRQIAQVLGLSSGTVSRLAAYDSWEEYEAHKAKEVQKQRERLAAQAAAAQDNRASEDTINDTELDEAVEAFSTPKSAEKTVLQAIEELTGSINELTSTIKEILRS